MRATNAIYPVNYWNKDLPKHFSFCSPFGGIAFIYCCNESRRDKGHAFVLHVILIIPFSPQFRISEHTLSTIVEILAYFDIMDMLKWYETFVLVRLSKIGIKFVGL